MAWIGDDYEEQTNVPKEKKRFNWSEAREKLRSAVAKRRKPTSGHTKGRKKQRMNAHPHNVFSGGLHRFY